MTGLFNVAVAVAAVDAELAVVQRVAEGHRLDRRIADPGVFRRGVIRGGGRDDATEQKQKNNDLQR